MSSLHLHTHIKTDAHMDTQKRNHAHTQTPIHTETQEYSNTKTQYRKTNTVTNTQKIQKHTNKWLH